MLVIVYIRSMQHQISLLFLTSGIPLIPAILACLASAAAGGLIVWYTGYRFEKRSAKRNEKTIKKLELLTYLTQELRTPVTLITTPLQKLAENSYDEETDRELQRMQQNAGKILAILDKTMNIDKIDEDEKSLRFREINLVKYVQNLLSVFKYQAKFGGVEIAFHCSKDRITAWLDRYQFDEVLMNLIGAILKSTPPGNKLDIEVADDDKSSSIIISSHGKALTEEHITHLFELFKRSDSGAVTDTNMELYLCKDIVSKHKGSITVRNFAEKDGYSCTIRLPQGNAHISKDQLTSRNGKLDETWSIINSSDNSDSGYADKGSASGRQYSIIAIDEYPDICNYLRLLLSPRFNITTFTNPSEGLNAAISEVPDLVIAEIMMSGIDGISLVKRLKSNANTAHVPVLLMTALPGEDVRLQGLLTGADAIISKPFNEEEFILSCNNLIVNRSRLASHIKEKQISSELLQPVELEGNNDALIKKVLEVINEHLSDPGLNVEMLAGAIGISRGHLHRKIKEITGMSPGEYIRTIRLNQAAQLLKGEKKNIAQIAYSVGYSNPSVFSTAFRQFFGLSAKDYQKRYLGSKADSQAQS